MPSGGASPAPSALALAVVLVTAGALQGGDGLRILGIGALIGLLALVVVAPVVTGPICRTLGRPLSSAPRRAPGPSLGTTPCATRRRTAATASALMIGVGLVAFVTVFAASVARRRRGVGRDPADRGLRRHRHRLPWACSPATWPSADRRGARRRRGVGAHRHPRAHRRPARRHRRHRSHRLPRTGRRRRQRGVARRPRRRHRRGRPHLGRRPRPATGRNAADHVPADRRGADAGRRHLRAVQLRRHPPAVGGHDAVQRHRPVRHRRAGAVRRRSARHPSGAGGRTRAATPPSRCRTATS